MFLWSVRLVGGRVVKEDGNVRTADLNLSFGVDETVSGSPDFCLQFYFFFL